MMDEAEHVKKTRKRLEKFLKDKNYTFNPDSDIVNSILTAMAKRHTKLGKDYCPCRRVTGDQKKDDQIVCPCVFHRQEIEDDGHCHCMLFTKKQTGKTDDNKEQGK